MADADVLTVDGFDVDVSHVTPEMAGVESEDDEEEADKKIGGFKRGHATGKVKGKGVSTSQHFVC